MACPEVERTSINKPIPSNRDTFALQEQSKPSLGFLQSAAGFTINDGSIASIGGDSFTARGDVHVTINHNYPSNENQEPESETANSSSIQTQRGTFSEDTFSRTPLPIQRSCDIYRRHLEAKGRGKCLWIPELSKNLPIPYQRTGITIGDVGIITPSGSFIFLFNVCLPKGHPTNPSKMPTSFEPIASDVIQEFNISVQREFREHSYLASVSSVRVRRDGESTGLVFESSEQDGAILTMPVGAKSEDLTNIVSFRKYVTANLASWYRYAYHIRGFEVRNGDLRVVTGTDKTSAWGMATFSNSGAGCSSTRQESASLVPGNQPKFHLEFGLIENGNEASDRKVKRYGWEYSGVAEVRAGPDAREIAELRGDDVDEEDAVYENQCLFIRTLNATLPEKVWEQLGIDEEEADFGYGYGYHSMNDSNTNGSSSSSSSERGGNGNNGSRLNQGGSFSSSASHNQAAISTSSLKTGSIGPYSWTTPDYSSSISLADHPSNLINQFLLNNCSEDTSMAVTLDQDWISVLREDDCVLPSSEELLERIMEAYDIREEDGIVFLDAKCQSLDGTSHASSNLAILYSEDNILEVGAEEPLASLEDFDFDVAGTGPTISNCESILKSTYQTMEKVKFHTQTCKNLCDRNKQLLQEIRDLDMEEAPNIVNEIYRIIVQIDRKAQDWSSWSQIQSFVRSGELLQDLERCQAEIHGLWRKISDTNAGSRPLKFKSAKDRDKPSFKDQRSGPVPTRMTTDLEDPYPFGCPSSSPSLASPLLMPLDDQQWTPIPHREGASINIMVNMAGVHVHPCTHYTSHHPFRGSALTGMPSSQPPPGHFENMLRQHLIYGDDATSISISPSYDEVTPRPPSINYSTPSYQGLGLANTSGQDLWGPPPKCRVSLSGCTPPPIPITTPMIHPILRIGGHSQISFDVNFSSNSTRMLDKNHQANAQFSSGSNSLIESMKDPNSILGSKSDLLLPALTPSRIRENQYKEVKKEVLCHSGTFGTFRVYSSDIFIPKRQPSTRTDQDVHFSNFYNNDNSLNTDDWDFSSFNLGGVSFAPLVVTNAGTVPQGTKTSSIDTSKFFRQMMLGGLPSSAPWPFNDCVAASGINRPVSVRVSFDGQPLITDVRDRATTEPHILGQLVPRDFSCGASSTVMTTIPLAQASSIIASVSYLNMTATAEVSAATASPQGSRTTFSSSDSSS